MANEDTTIPEVHTNEESKISADDGEEEESQVMSTMSTTTILLNDAVCAYRSTGDIANEAKSGGDGARGK